MYGRRGKVGHISASRGDTFVYEFYRIAPKDVLLLNTTGEIRKIDKEDIEKQVATIEAKAIDLKDSGAQIIFIGGRTSPCFPRISAGEGNPTTNREACKRPPAGQS